MGPGSQFDVSSRRQDGRLVVSPTGELDIAAVDRVRACIEERVAGEGLVLDLRGLHFLDTSGLQLVVEAYRRAGEEGFDLIVLRGTRNVQRVFEIAGLDRVLPFSDASPD